MLTARGRALIALGVGLLIVGRVLGLRELLMAGATLFAVVAIGALSVWLRRSRFEVDRILQPAKVPAGGEVEVRLTLRSSGLLGAGPTLLRDDLPEQFGGPVRLTVEGLRPGLRDRRARYVLRPDLRGRYPIGPLEAIAVDPFGTVERSRRAREASPLIVYPSFEPIDTLPSGTQRLGALRRSPALGPGDEFYTLRPYEDGDDMRKVHWPSSMKLGELLIRQHELTGDPRAFIVLDTCIGKHRGEGHHSSLEAAISACAAVAVLSVRRRMRTDILVPEGPLLPPRQQVREEEILEGLALLGPSRHSSLLPALEVLASGSILRAGMVVVITPELSSAEIGALAHVVRGATGGAIVSVDAASFLDDTSPAPKTSASAMLGLPAMQLRAGDSFRRTWETGVRRVPVAR